MAAYDATWAPGDPVIATCRLGCLLEKNFGRARIDGDIEKGEQFEYLRPAPEIEAGWHYGVTVRDGERMMIPFAFDHVEDPAAMASLGLGRGPGR